LLNDGGAGGAGVSNSITGTATDYAGGGGGGAYATGGAGGSGVGGTGNNGGAPTANRGGGGGGNRNYLDNSGGGGSGVVILRYPEGLTAVFGTGLTGTESAASGGYKRATCTAGSGLINWK